MLNSNKKGITLDLKTERGKALFQQLVPHVDVIVENFALGVMDKLGLGYEVLQQLNPRWSTRPAPAMGATAPIAPIRPLIPLSRPCRV